LSWQTFRGFWANHIIRNGSQSEGKRTARTHHGPQNTMRKSPTPTSTITLQPGTSLICGKHSLKSRTYSSSMTTTCTRPFPNHHLSPTDRLLVSMASAPTPNTCNSPPPSKTSAVLVCTGTSSSSNTQPSICFTPKPMNPIASPSPVLVGIGSNTWDPP
jgi:hypothetical protein